MTDHAFQSVQSVTHGLTYLHHDHDVFPLNKMARTAIFRIVLPVQPKNITYLTSLYQLNMDLVVQNPETQFDRGKCNWFKLIFCMCLGAGYQKSHSQFCRSISEF